MESPTSRAQVEEAAREAAAEHQHLEGPLLPILHAIQARLGWTPDAAVPVVAEALNLSRADVHGVVTFYHDFRHAPPARHVLKLCRAEACQARGADRTLKAAEMALGVELGETDPLGAVAIEPVYCLGLCASGPAALWDGDPVAGALLDELLEGF